MKIRNFIGAAVIALALMVSPAPVAAAEVNLEVALVECTLFMRDDSGAITKIMATIFCSPEGCRCAPSAGARQLCVT